MNLNWANDSLWDDGAAEVARYAAERITGGKVRRFEYAFLTVKEDFLVKEDYATELLVKSDNITGMNFLRAMKVNLFARIETDEYPYHFLTSIFLRRDNPAVMFKLTHSSQEWQGNTFKELLQFERAAKLIYHSYWEGEGDGKQELGTYILTEDQLPFSLRALAFSDTLKVKQRILETLITNKVGTPQLYDAAIEVKAPEQLRIDSTMRMAWRVEVLLAPAKKNIYWFDKAAPNLLLKHTAWDGRKLDLKSVSRYNYGENQPKP
ncbi:MAG: hypothetical protein IAF08_07905 [Rhizobacter sp.]|nr:hypothetical protein [Chlorobiales bacterium]